MKKLMTIGNLAKSTGLRVQTIRYYEEIEITPKPKRSSAGYRLYTEDSVDRINFIKEAKKLGFTLNEIKSIFHVMETKKEGCDEFLKVISKKLNQVKAQIKELSDVQQSLEGILKTSPNYVSNINSSFINTLVQMSNKDEN